MFLTRFNLLSVLSLFAILSCLASFLAGLLTLREFRSKPFTLFILGFSNFFSIIGFSIIVYSLRTESTDSSAISQVLEELRGKGYQRNRFLAFICFFISALSLSLAIYSHWQKKAILGYESFYQAFPLEGYLLAFVFLLLGARLSVVREEDEELFKELKENGYSTWFLFPQDKSKFVFILVFSLLFLFLVFLITPLLELPLLCG
ncbi:hypothetical protein H5T87_08965 [bacterium]|nr:hypothetical protein [bacterium]